MSSTDSSAPAPPPRSPASTAEIASCTIPTCAPKPMPPLAIPDSENECDAQLAGYAKALGHPARIAILRLLLQQQACICGQIVDQLPLAQSTVSQHLKVLKKAGLIRGTIDGPRVCYCVDPPALTLFATLLRGLSTDLTDNAEGG